MAHAFVLVHGGWLGGWCWRRVADRLRERGHVVFTPTLTGLGERSHLLSAGIDLDTHIADVVNVVKWERLNDVVLCGHSFSGFVISGVAEQIAPAIRSIVFLDAFVPSDGDSIQGPRRRRNPRWRSGRHAARECRRVAAISGNVWRQRSRPRLGGRPVRAAADSHAHIAHRAQGRPRADRAEGLYPCKRI